MYRVSITNGKGLILWKKIIIVCFENCMKHISRLCGQYVQSFDVKLGGTCVCIWTYKQKALSDYSVETHQLYGLSERTDS